MMYKEKSKRSAMVKYLVAVPVLVAMLIIFSSNQMNQEKAENSLIEQEQVYSSIEDEIREKLVAKGIDIENINQNDPNQLREIEEALKEITETVFDFDIRVEKNGFYTFPPSDKNHDDIREYFKAIKVENRSVVIEVDLGADSKHITSLLDCAQDLGLKVIMNDLIINEKEEIQINANKLVKTYPFIDPELIKSGVKGYRTMTVLATGAYIHNKTPITDQEVVQIISLIKEKEGQLYIRAIKGSKWGRISNLMSIAANLGVKAVVENLNFPDNFNGRRITERNWKAIIKDLNKADGKVIIKAEANTDGRMIYVEVDSNRSTVTDKDILKRALTAAKGYKIEVGKGTANGTIIFNYSKDRNNKNYHDEYINQYNYGESDKDRSMIDLIEDFTKDNNDPIFKVVEEMPRFPGCEDMKGTVNEKEECAKQKMLEFVYSNLKYPSKARDAGVEGMCVVQFVIEKDGAVTEAKIVRDIGADCGVETKKVINNFPIWIPGKQKGKTVRVMYTLPVKFKLEGDTKKQEDAKIVAFGEANQKIKEENLIIDKKTEKKEDIFKVVQEMPRFSGCEDMEGTAKEKEECAKGKMLEYIYTNIRYPIEAKTKGIDGMSVISLVIEKDGAVTNVGTLRDPGLGTGAEAARIVRGMPKWIPGKQNGKTVRVQYTLPVKFKLEKEINEMPSKLEKLLKGKTAGISIIVDSERKIRLTSTNHNGPDPLYVVDGKIQKITSIESESINPDDIESINVLKGEKATEKYGDKGENGVIEITMKSDGLNKDYTYKTSLKYTVNQFKEVKDIAHLLRDVGLKAESKAEILHFRIVRIQEREDAEPLYSDDGTFNQNVKDLIAKTKVNDRYFFEDITVKIDGKEENIGALSIMIVDGMPSLVNSLVVVNGKIETSDWMNNINPEDIAKMDILNGEKMIEKYGDIPHNSVVEVTLKSDKRVTKNLYESKSNKLNTIKFSANPNPSDGNFNVIYQLEKNIPVNLTFYSIEGKTIKRMLNLPAENNINIDLSNHNLPLIYITLEQDGKTKTIKATFQK